MNVYEYNGKNIFMTWEMDCSIRMDCSTRGEAELKRTFHLSPSEKILTIARMKTLATTVHYRLKVERFSSGHWPEISLPGLSAQSMHLGVRERACVIYRVQCNGRPLAIFRTKNGYGRPLTALHGYHGRPFSHSNFSFSEDKLRRISHWVKETRWFLVLNHKESHSQSF